MKLFDIGFVFGRVLNDLLLTFLALLFAWCVRMIWFDVFPFTGLNLASPVTLYPWDLFIPLAIKISFIVVSILALSGCYRLDRDDKVSDELAKVVVGYSLGFTILVVLFYFSQLLFFSRAIMGLAWGTGILLVLGGRLFLRLGRRWLYSKGIGQKRILLLGSLQQTEDVLAFLKNTPKYKIIGYVSEKKTTAKTINEISIIGTFSQFDAILKDQKPDEVLLISDNSSKSLNTELVKIAHINHVKFHFLPDEFGLDLAAVEVSTLGKSPLITLLETKIIGWGALIKSIADFFLSLFALLILSPVLLVCAILVFLDDPRAPIIYKSKRVGKSGNLFSCYKFRSMVADAEKQKKTLTNQRKGDVLFKVSEDPRITKLGKTLRQWSLDELPQFWNVLKGDMSLIGPRPHLPEEVEKYNKDDLRVLSARPGITGFAQINGRSSLSYEDEMKYELFYLKNWSIWFDVVIAVKSVWVVLTRKNAE